MTPIVSRDTSHEPGSSQIRSSRESTNFNVGDETIMIERQKMVKDMGNVELFELFETEPKTQCKECQSFWSEGIVYCTCGHLLKESAANRGVIEYTLDLL